MELCGGVCVCACKITSEGVLKEVVDDLEGTGDVRKPGMSLARKSTSS